MKLDISVAPEIALLAVGQDAAARPPVTIGYLARCLRLLVADPQAWWDLVRFDPGRAVRADVPPPGPGCQTWLLVLPPGYRGDGQQGELNWDVACLVAGEIAGPGGPPGRPLRPGPIQVRGGGKPHPMVNTGSGYAVSLHARPAPASPAPMR